MIGSLCGEPSFTNESISKRACAWACERCKTNLRIETSQKTSPGTALGTCNHKCFACPQALSFFKYFITDALTASVDKDNEDSNYFLAAKLRSVSSVSEYNCTCIEFLNMRVYMYM
jgi:hypothetical protein